MTENNEIIVPERIPVKMIGAEEAKRIHEQMGNDFIIFLQAQGMMFVELHDLPVDSDKAVAVADFINYVYEQWKLTA